LTDEYSLFYFRFLANKKTKNSWLQITNQASYKIWLGIAFENLCLKHTTPIKKALGIEGIITNEYTWAHQGNKKEQGAQIDLIIDRSDNCVNLLELKFYNTPFVISKQYEAALQQKLRNSKNKQHQKRMSF